jgi:hypothetical protein
MEPTTTHRKPTTNANDDWGPHPPRRLRKAKDIHAHMRRQADYHIKGEWYTVGELVYWYNNNHRYDITSNWLANVLVRNPRKFVKGPNVAVRGFDSTKVVAVWKAI